METRKEVIFSELGSQCQPAEHISEQRERYKWNSVYFETPKVKGHFLASLGNGTPQNVTLDPKLTGWYRIFVAQPALWSSGQQSDLLLKLDNAPAFEHFSHTGQTLFSLHRIQEAHWCCADMTGRSIVIGKEKYGKGMDAALAWLRFVPMDEAEVEAFLADQARTDTKNIYATNDMHGMLCKFGYQNIDGWRSVVQDYVQSDVEWLSIENIRVFDGELETGDPDNFTFPRLVDERVQRMLKNSFTLDMVRQLVVFGHEKGLKMCGSVRMGCWGMEYPFDNMSFHNKFAKEHPEFRCVDRDGSAVFAQSFMYTETQDYIIGRLVEVAEQGMDAVELLAVRGVPYILFEQPFVDLFMARYGEDPRPLPLDDERVVELKCEVLTGFIRRLRQRLDEICGKGKVRLHLRGMYCLYDNRLVGLDVEKLAAEGLIDAFICYPQRIREQLEGDIWQDESHTKLDIDKLHDYAINAEKSIMYRKSDLYDAPPMADSRGVLQGPAGEKERVEEIAALENKYGVQVYFEVLPRLMPCADFRDRAAELYSYGAKRLSLWDTYDRVPRRILWTMMRRAGHREELASYPSGEGELYSYHRITKYADMDVSRYAPAWGG